MQPDELEARTFPLATDAVDDFLARYPEPVREIALAARRWLKAALPGTAEQAWRKRNRE